jgi:hypothetical protein
MKFEEVLPALREGKKVRRKSWDTNTFITNPNLGNIATTSLMADDWEVCEEPKKPRLLAHALLNDIGHVELSCCLYASEKEARDVIGDSFISWPAVANAEGFYSVEEK